MQWFYFMQRQEIQVVSGLKIKVMRCTSHSAGTASAASNTFWRWQIWEEETHTCMLKSNRITRLSSCDMFMKQSICASSTKPKTKNMMAAGCCGLFPLTETFFMHVSLRGWNRASSEADCSTAGSRTPGTPNTGLPPAAPPEMRWVSWSVRCVYHVLTY